MMTVEAVEDKQAIVNLRKQGKSIRGIVKTLGTANIMIMNVLKKNETTGVLNNTDQGKQQQPKKSQQLIFGKDQLNNRDWLNLD